jgi:hypothetical protein
MEYRSWNNNWTVGKYEIHGGCMESWPCQHWIKNIQTKKMSIRYGTEIYKMLKKDNLSHPHFEEYKDYKGVQEDLSDTDEIDESEFYRKEEEEMKKLQEKRALDSLIDKTKASSRLEKLKKQNSICK